MKPEGFCGTLVGFLALCKSFREQQRAFLHPPLPRVPCTASLRVLTSSLSVASARDHVSVGYAPASGNKGLPGDLQNMGVVFLREPLLAKEIEVDSSQDVIRRKCEN